MLVEHNLIGAQGGNPYYYYSGIVTKRVDPKKGFERADFDSWVLEIDTVMGFSFSMFGIALEKRER